jgi:hypothetical protein
MYVEMDAIAEEGVKIRKIAQEEISPLITKLIELLKELKWQGEACNTFKSQYIDKVLYLYDISLTVDKIGEFLGTVSSSWTEIETQTNKKWSSYEEEVDALREKLGILRDQLKDTEV